MRVLVAGYERYANTLLNPAECVAKRLDGERIGGAEIIGQVVPSYWFKSIQAVQQYISEVEPQVVILLGEYGGRAMITVERLAHNLNDSSRYQLADNAGRVLQGELTAPEGPAGYFSTLPIRAMVKGMRHAGIPADISDTLGTLMCNHLMYGVLHHVAVKRLPIRAGFVHLPYLPSTAALEENLGTPSMSEETSAAGVRAAIEAAIAHEFDIQKPVASRFQI